MIKLIASDLDNTALYNGRLSEENSRAIQRALDNNFEFVVVTGRGLSAVTEDFYNLKGFAYAITSNGASITNVRTGERIGHFTLDRQTVNKLFDIGRSNGASFEIFVEGRGHVSREYYDDPLPYGIPEKLIPYIRFSRSPVENLDKYISDNSEQIENFVFVVKNEDMHRQIVEQVKVLCPDTFVVDCDSQWVEVMSRSCSKGNGLKILSDFIGIDRTEVAALGDGDNDIEMLEFAGLPIAMGNASDRLKSAARFVTTDVRDNGLAYAVNLILEGKLDCDVSSNAITDVL